MSASSWWMHRDRTSAPKQRHHGTSHSGLWNGMAWASSLHNAAHCGDRFSSSSVVRIHESRSRIGPVPFALAHDGAIKMEIPGDHAIRGETLLRRVAAGLGRYLVNTANRLRHLLDAIDQESRDAVLDDLGE